MDTVQIDPAQLQLLLDAINTGANVLVSAVACVCFWLGMNSWETVAK